jgi:predicted Zn-dependent peptidase
MQKESDYDYIASLNLREILFANSPLARAYDGTIQSIKSITLDDIKKFISTHLGYDNLIVVAGGDIEQKSIEEYTNRIASILPHSKTKPFERIKVSDKQITRYISKETQQAYIYFGAPFDYAYDAPDQYKAKIAEYILGGGGFGSRLMEEIRVKRGLSYGAYSMLRETKEASYLSGYLQTKLSTQKEAMDVVQSVVDEFVAKGITQDELKAAKEFLVGSEPLRVESLSQRLNRAFNEYYYNRGLGYSKKQLQQIQDASLQEINDFIKSHKELTKLSFSVVTKSKDSK